MLRSSALACLCACALGLAAAAGAGAQVTGLYYQEVEKEGRIYLFNTPERYKSFEESGEVGTAITLIGKGKDGQTLVAENETAIDLYLMKNDLPGYDRATPTAEKKFDDRVFYKDGKTNIVMKTGQVAISNRVQVRYTHNDPDGGEEVGSFRIRRMKTAIEGSAYEGLWRFKLQANWVGTGYLTSASLDDEGSLSTRSSRGPILEDAEVWFAAEPLATIWLGQGKAFFGRQELTSSGKQQFVDRSIASVRFAPSRQIGAGLIGVNEAKTFEYNLGIYNGNGINTTANDNDDYMTLGRVVWTPFGEYKLEESSIDYPDTPKLALGVGYLTDTQGTGTSETDIERLGAELAFKIKGFNAVGEWYQEESELIGLPAVDTDGYYAQVGYLFPNRKFELAARLAEILPDTDTNTDQTESGIGASWYWDRHNHKIQADYLTVENEATGLDVNELRLQLQLIF